MPVYVYLRKSPIWAVNLRKSPIWAVKVSRPLRFGCQNKTEYPLVLASVIVYLHLCCLLNEILARWVLPTPCVPKIQPKQKSEPLADDSQICGVRIIYFWCACSHLNYKTNMLSFEFCLLELVDKNLLDKPLRRKRPAQQLGQQYHVKMELCFKLLSEKAARSTLSIFSPHEYWLFQG